MDKGYFVISLDFELIYGVLDWPDKHYYKNLFGARKAIPQILKLFEQYSISATWGIVGMLFHENKEELLRFLPEKKPHYWNKKLSTYQYLDGIKPEEEKLYFSKGLIEQIAKCPNQEMATHTYSHYYCEEKGQTMEEFEADMEKAVTIMQNCGYARPVSVIFPRNMCNKQYLNVLENYKISTYRGAQKTWIDKIPVRFLMRIFRFLDGYVNLTGRQCYELEQKFPVNIPASRFLYPVRGRFPILEKIKIRRIKGQMKYAATHNKVFHLWWHPHNFGTYTKKNLINLEEILKYYTILQKRYGFKSVNMQMLGKWHRENIEKLGEQSLR